MAIYHLHAKIHSRSQGRSSVACAAYRAGEKIQDRRTGIIHNFQQKKGVLHSEIVAPEGAPEWVYNRAELWNQVEQAEDKSRRRASAQVAREVEIALPNELNESQQTELTRSFIQSQFVNKGMVADFAIHDTGKGRVIVKSGVQAFDQATL